MPLYKMFAHNEYLKERYKPKGTKELFPENFFVNSVLLPFSFLVIKHEY